MLVHTTFKSIDAYLYVHENRISSYLDFLKILLIKIKINAKSNVKQFRSIKIEKLLRNKKIF